MMRQRDALITCRSCRGIGYTVWRIRNLTPDGRELATWRHEVEKHGDQLPDLGPGWNPTCPACGNPMQREAVR